MAEHVVPYDFVLDNECGWEPNAPGAFLASDDFGRAALAQNAHPDDPDQRCVVLRWDMVIFARMAPPNDEGRQAYRLYGAGLRALMWTGIVQDSSLVEQLKPSWSQVGDGRRAHPIHYVVVAKECVVEVVALDVEVFRIDGRPRTAAPASFAGPDALLAHRPLRTICGMVGRPWTPSAQQISAVCAAAARSHARVRR